jgi:N-acetylneuraminic acid mutarotase
MRNQIFSLVTIAVVVLISIIGVLKVFKVCKRGADIMIVQIFVCLVLSSVCVAQTWQKVESVNLPSKRHECAAAIADHALYLFGGRGIRPVDRYEFKTNTWDSVAEMPLQLNHFQAVTYQNIIYIAGAFTGSYPHEKPVAEVYAFNPKTNKWAIETRIPDNRRRGAAACVVYKSKLYLICGIVDGHYDGHVAWVDEYNFETKTWTQLPDAPHARDHFQSVIVKGKLYNAGGRRSSAKTNETFQLTVPEVDVYDLASGSWRTLDSSSNIPTLRAGCTAVASGKNSFIVIGGESQKQREAHNEAENFDVRENRWVKATRLEQGRHGTQAVVYKRKIYIAAGSANKGGGPELNDVEVCNF